MLNVFENSLKNYSSNLISSDGIFLILKFTISSSVKSPHVLDSIDSPAVVC